MVKKYNQVVFMMVGVSLAFVLLIAANFITAQTVSHTLNNKQTAYMKMDSKAESIIPANDEINTQAGRSPIVILSVLTIVLILSGTLYVAQKEQK